VARVGNIVKPRVGAGIVLAAALVSGCGGGHHAAAPPVAPSGGSGSTSTAPPTTAPSHPRPHRSAHHGPPAGAGNLQSAALVDAATAAWVHVSSSLPVGDVSFTCRGVTGPGVGERSCTVGGGTVATTLAPNGTAYVSGDAAGLHGAGLGPHVAARLSGRWIAIGLHSSSYAVVSRDLTINGLLTDIRLSGDLRMDPARRLDGQRVLGVTGTATGPSGPSGRATLWVSDDDHPLPVAWTGAGTMNFTGWGQAASIQAPAAAVPLRQAT